MMISHRNPPFSALTHYWLIRHSLCNTFVLKVLHTCQLLSNFQQNSCIAEPVLHSPLHAGLMQSCLCDVTIICTCTISCMYSVHACIHVYTMYMYMNMYIHVHACVHVQMYIYMYMYMHVLYMYTCTCISCWVPDRLCVFSADERSTQCMHH